MRILIQKLLLHTPRGLRVKLRNIISSLLPVSLYDLIERILKKQPLSIGELYQEQRHAKNLIKANDAIDDDTRWLAALNAYLGASGLAPVTLLPKSGSRFERLHCAEVPKANEGALVSVIMPAYNAEKTLEVAVRSILNQSWQNLELLIVDDRSTDTTWEIMQRLAAEDGRIRLLRNAANVGAYVSKNLALQSAKGAYITGHDADDWAHPQRIERHLNVMLASDTPVLAGCSAMLRMTESGVFLARKDGSFLRRACISAIYQRAWFQQHVGHWDSVRFAADAELLQRAEILLQAQYADTRQCLMLCLDAETSLTNNPVSGLNPKGTHSPRLEYSKAAYKWHQTLPESSAYMPFPLIERPFAAPEKARVPVADVQACLAQ